MASASYRCLVETCLTSMEHIIIPVAMCWMVSLAPMLFFEAATRVVRAEALSSAAWNCRPYRCKEEKASSARSAALADAESSDKATRRRMLPTLVGS